MSDTYAPKHTVIDFNVYADVIYNKQLLLSLIQQWINIYNKANRTSFEYVAHDIIDARHEHHKKVNVTIAYSGQQINYK